MRDVWLWSDHSINHKLFDVFLLYIYYILYIYYVSKVCLNKTCSKQKPSFSLGEDWQWLWLEHFIILMMWWAVLASLLPTKYQRGSWIFLYPPPPPSLPPHYQVFFLLMKQLQGELLRDSVNSPKRKNQDFNDIIILF